MRQTFRQPLVGQRLRELRERAGLSRAELSASTGVNASALARLENGDDVRLSTYLPILGYFLGRGPEAWMLAQRFVLLPTDARAQLSDLAAWFEKAERSGGEDE